MIARTDTGLVRQQNQDCVHTDPERHLFILADGVGGRAGGAVASRLAIDTIAQRLRRKGGHNWFGTRSGKGNIGISSLHDAVIGAHQALLAHARTNPEFKGMGCTVVAGVLDREHCLCVAVGGSRLYRLRGDRLQQISRDQTLANQLLEEGFLTPDDQNIERYSHVLTAVVGGDAPPPEVQQYAVDLEDGDVLLACSDGLSGMLDDQQIGAAIRRAPGLDESAAQLIGEANEAGGRDNISVILVSHTNPDRRTEHSMKQGGRCHASSPRNQGQ